VDAESIDKAQFLVYDAMEAWGRPEGIEFARQALQIDPENPDALGMMATLEEEPGAMRVWLERSLASAENRLGPNFEKRYRGIFWSELDTRPYMRALAALAQYEDAVGNRKTAITLFEKMLKLNPNDNQGVRYGLLGLVLAERMLVKARKLLEAYPDESGAWFAWGAVLYHFAMKDRPTATKLLKKARKQNPFVEHYLMGAKPIPGELPPYYSFGDESEAILAALDLGEAWSRRQNAMLWLSGQLSGDSSYVRYIARIIDGR
jgi:tetratricopeptide (TPR) repeat protein